MATWNLLNADDPTLARIAIGAAAGNGLSVVDYGAVGDGATDDTVAFQSAFDAATAAFAAETGPVEVFIPSGVWITTAALTVGAGVTLRGAGMGATTLKSTTTFTPSEARVGVIELTGASDITISDMTVQTTSVTTTSLGIYAKYAAGLQERVTVTRCRFLDFVNNPVRFGYAVRQLTFTDNIIQDCGAGLTMYAPEVATGLISSQITIANNRLRNVGSVNIQLYGAGASQTIPGNVSNFSDIQIIGNDLRDFAQTGPAGPIPIEPTNCTNIRIANNVIEGTATRGISTGNNVNMTCTGNTISGQSIYAFELNGGRQISIVGNVVEDCATFAMETGSGVLLSDLVIANNVYNSSGLSSTEAIDAISLVSAQRVRITGNIFTDWQYVRAAIRLGNAVAPVEDCVIEGNTFIITDANTPLNTILVRTASRTNIVGNTLRISRDLAAGDDYIAAIAAVMVSDVTDTYIANNHIMFTGTVSAATSSSGIGNNYSGGAVCPGMVVRDNHVDNGALGLLIRTTSTDAIVAGNDTSKCVAADTIPATAITPSKTGWLEFPSVSAQSYSDLTLALPGSITGDSIALGVPTASVAAGIAYTAWVSANDVVTVRAHNYSAGAVNPSNGLFRVTRLGV